MGARPAASGRGEEPQTWHRSRNVAGMFRSLHIAATGMSAQETKLDAVANAAGKFTATYAPLTYEEGLAIMGPIRDLGANRPV